MALGTPYTAITASQAGGVGTTLTGNYAQAASVGDILIIGVGNNGSGNFLTGPITDSKGNPFYLADNNYVTSDNNQVFVCVVKTATTTSDTISATFNTSGGAMTMIGRGISGGVGWNAIDVAVDTANASSTSPSLTTPVLRQSAEYACAFLCSANGGGSPTSWTGGFTAQTPVHITNNQYYTVADQVTSSTAALTAGATITAAAWSMIIVTVRAASSGTSASLRTGSAIVNTGSSSATTLTFTVPSGTVVGDIISIWVFGATSGRTYSATGYTVLAPTNTGGASISGSYLYKTAVSGDLGGTVVVTQSGAAAVWCGIIYSASGTQDPVPANGGQLNLASTTLANPGQTTTVNGDLLIWVGADRTGSTGTTPGTITIPTGFTSAVSQSNTTSASANNCGITLATATQSTAGATGAENGTISLSEASGSLTTPFSGSTISAAVINLYDKILMNVPVIDAGQW